MKPTKKNIHKLIEDTALATARTAAAAAQVVAAVDILRAKKDRSDDEDTLIKAFDALEAAHVAQEDHDGIRVDLCRRWARELGSGCSYNTAHGTFSISDRTSWKGACADALTAWDPVAAHKLVSEHTRPVHKLTTATPRANRAAYLARLR